MRALTGAARRWSGSSGAAWSCSAGITATASSPTRTARCAPTTRGTSSCSRETPPPHPVNRKAPEPPPTHTHPVPVPVPFPCPRPCPAAPVSPAGVSRTGMASWFVPPPEVPLGSVGLPVIRGAPRELQRPARLPARRGVPHNVGSARGVRGSGVPQPCPAGLCRSQHPAGSVGHRDLPVPDTQRARGRAQGCGVFALSSSSTCGLVRRAMVRETLAWTGSRGGIPTGTGQTDGHNLSTVLCPHHEPWHSASVTSREAPRSAAWSKRSHFWTSTPKLRTAVFTLVAERYQLPMAVKTALFFFFPPCSNKM